MRSGLRTSPEFRLAQALFYVAVIKDLYDGFMENFFGRLKVEAIHPLLEGIMRFKMRTMLLPMALAVLAACAPAPTPTPIPTAAALIVATAQPTREPTTTPTIAIQPTRTLTATPTRPAPSPTPLLTITPLPGASDVRSIAAIDGIRFYGAFPLSDLTYYNDALPWLKRAMPRWWDYMMAQEPVMISFAAQQSGGGEAFCCRVSESVPNMGFVTFEALSKTFAGEFPGEGIQGEVHRRRLIAGLFIHEYTHIRDFRTHRMDLSKVPLNLQSCVQHLSVGEVLLLWLHDSATLKYSNDPVAQAAWEREINSVLPAFEKDNTPPFPGSQCAEYYKPTYSGLAP